MVTPIPEEAASRPARPGASAYVVNLLRAHGLALAAWTWAAAYLLWTRTEPLRLNWGDPWSDSHIQQHGRYFAEYGFIRNAFIAVTDVGPLTDESLKYTHYPPLPDIINGTQQWILGPVGIATHRLFADLFILGSLYFFYRWTRALFGGKTANVAMVFTTTCAIWLQYADTIHHVPVYWFFGTLALFTAQRWVERPSRARLALVFAATLLCDMASYDWFFFVPVLTAATIWLSGKRLRDRAMWPLLAAVGGGVVAAVLLKLVLVAWAVGPREMIRDFLFQLEERATAKHSTDYRGGFWLIFYHRSVRFFTPLFLVVLGANAIALAAYVIRRERSTNLPPPHPLLVLLAGAPFVVLFSQLLVEQYHPTLQFVPYYAIASGAAVAWAWERRGAIWRSIAVGAVVFAIGWEARELIAFEKVFLDREDTRAVARYLDEKDSRIVVFTNTIIDAPFRYYFQRHGLSLLGVEREGVIYTLDHFFNDHGDAPVHFMVFPDVEKAAFDKGLFALFSADKRWSWIADPYRHRAEWEPKLREKNARTLALIDDIGTEVLHAGRMRLVRIDRAALDAYMKRWLGGDEARFIDFGEATAARHKLRGFRYSEKYDGELGFSWTMDRVPKRYRFTLRGLMSDPVGAPPEHVASIQLIASSASKLTFDAFTSVQDQKLDVLLNGHVLGTVDVPSEWSKFSVGVPEGTLSADGFQKIDLRWSRSNEYELGVALRSLELE